MELDDKVYEQIIELSDDGNLKYKQFFIEETIKEE